MSVSGSAPSAPRSAVKTFQGPVGIEFCRVNQAVSFGGNSRVSCPSGSGPQSLSDLRTVGEAKDWGPDREGSALSTTRWVTWGRFLELRALSFCPGKWQL